MKLMEGERKNNKKQGNLMKNKKRKNKMKIERKKIEHQLVVCKYNVPHYPMKRTTIMEPYEEHNRKKKRILYENYKTIKTKLNLISQDIKSYKNMTYDEFLQSLSMTENEYLAAIQTHIKRPMILLKRNVGDIKINPFNESILELHQANMDIQFILDPYACVSYVVNYINKSQSGMASTLKECADLLKKGNNTIQKQFRSIANCFVNKSEISAQEAVYHLLSMPMSHCSRASIYVNTVPIEERTKLVKPKFELQQLDPESTDIVQLGLLDHYKLRPTTLEDICLADFASLYNYKKSVNAKNVTVNNEILNEDEPNNEIVEDDITSNWIPLIDKSGYIQLRTKPKVIRYRKYNIHQDEINYYREHLLLFNPWRESEPTNMDAQSYYETCKEIIMRNRIKYIHNEFIDYDNILEDIVDENHEEVIDNNAENETDRIPAEFVIHDIGYDHADIGLEIYNEPGRAKETFIVPKLMQDNEYYQLISCLNEKQYRYHIDLMHKLKTQDTQFYHFISGGAGVGKSLLINVITQSILRLYQNVHNEPDNLFLLKCAPTGKAAFGIRGTTLHSTFSLPINQSSMNRLSADTANTLAHQLHHVKVIIIDEISMTGRRVFSQINQRLQQIFKTNQLFGGKSLIVLGDFNQLKPVMDGWIFECENDALGILQGAYLWSKFHLYELTEIMRQREDKTFAEALNNLAAGVTTKEDNDLFISRQCDQLPANVEIPKDSMVLFPTNALVNNYNVDFLNSLQSEAFNNESVDYCIGEGTMESKKRMLEYAKILPSNKTQGLSNEVMLKVGARYMLTVNIRTEDGLTNGACGRLIKISYGFYIDESNNRIRVPIRVYLKFEDVNVGSVTRSEFLNQMKNNNIPLDLTPINHVTRTMNLRKSSAIQLCRKQFPLTPAEAITIHKSQGGTYQNVVVNVINRMDKRMLYVAFSRATSAKGLFIKGQYRAPMPEKNCDKVRSEMLRLRMDNPLHLGLMFPKDYKTDERILFIYQNVRSLNKHLSLVKSDRSFTACDIVSLVETWTLPQDDIDINDYLIIQRQDCQGIARKAFGTVTYVKSTLFNSMRCFYKNINRHKNGYMITTGIIINNYCIITIYKSPKFPFTQFKCNMSRAFEAIKKENVQYSIIVGDFNINLNDTKSKSNLPLLEFMENNNLFSILPYDTITTDNNTFIDLCFSNNKDLNIHVFESIFSDHKPIWFQLEQ